jgi:uncharacterized protein YndB with AHSA1/START domain/uncharacterized glyoxalase superfamily protein PhnB
MANSITPFLMFIGTAEEALRFYIGLFDNSSITHIDRYGPGESGVEGSVKTASATIAGQPVMVIDSAVKHKLHTVDLVFCRLRERNRTRHGVQRAFRRRRSADAAGQLRLQPQICLGQRPLWRVMAAQLAMSSLLLEQPPVALTAMLIRRPVAEVFAAFVDPTITTRFWFTRSTGHLEPGARVTWFWDMYGASAPVLVKSIEADKRIVIEWGDDNTSTTVEWTFTPLSDNGTFVKIVNSGFHGSADSQARQAVDSTGGFTWVLAGLKAWLEHGIALNAIADRHPAGLSGAH